MSVAQPVIRVPDQGRTQGQVQNQAQGQVQDQVQGQVQSPVVYTNNDYSCLRRFSSDSPLRNYIAVKKPQSQYDRMDTTTLQEVLQHLKEIVSEERLYDPNNASIILCDAELEAALNVKALHLIEIRDQVCKQLVTLARPNPLPAQSATPNTQRLPQTNMQVSANAPSANETRQPVTTRPLQSDPSGGQGQGQNTIQLGSQRVSVEGQQQTNNGLTGIIPLEAKFRVKPMFREVLALVPGVPPSKMVFTYEELTKLLSAYILQNKRRFFDDRNIKVCLVGTDLLGKAFNVKAFHRTQVTGLLRSQLIPYKEEKDSDDPDPQPPQNDEANKTDDKDQKEDQKCEDIPIAVEAAKARSVNTSVEKSNAKPAVNRRVRKRSSSDDDSVEIILEPIDTKRSRRDSRSFSVSIATFKSSNEGYRSDDQESIYSEQGYETVAIGTISHDDSDSDSCSDSSVSESDAATIRLSDHENEQVFTEYEVDSEADREEEKALVGDNGNDSSESDSEFEDVAIAISAAMMMKADEDKSDGSDFWADSESDFELSNYDPELGPAMTETWKCVNCGNPNTPGIRYCHRCWKERKGWVPDRPKPKKRKNKKTEGLPIKKSFVRSNSEESTSNSDSVQLDPEQTAGCSSAIPKLTRSVSEDASKADDSPVDSGCFSQSSQEDLLMIEDPVSSQDVLEKQSSQELCLTSRPKLERSFSEEGPSSKIAESGCFSDEIAVVKGAISSDSDSSFRRNMFGKRFATLSSCNADLLCNFCLKEEKNAGIIHGKLIHQICCYKCARKLYKSKKPCPMCRRKIEKISKIIVG